jgi:ATP-binding cassette subfamily F protein uup
MREQRQQRREQVGLVQGQVNLGGKTGLSVLKTKNLGVRFGERWIFRGLTTELLRGDRLGVIGRNGSGKTTLLKTLLTKLAATEGEVKLGTNLEVGVFDQLHEGLKLDQTVMDNVLDGATSIPVPGGSKHVLGYLQDFLFTPEQARGPASRLSGGERNRLALARILARPCNLLVLDEPTNDLDLETMDFLEGLLLGFPGTIILVSHDREFLDQVVTAVLVIDDKGGISEYVGGYEDRYLFPSETRGEAKRLGSSQTRDEKSKAPKSKKLGFKEKRELE